jgi:hypothetical protein
MQRAQQLSAKQLLCVDLLAAGCSDRQAAEEVAVDRATVWRWRTSDAAFQAELNARRQELWEATADRLRALLPRALDVIEDAIVGGDRNTAIGFIRLVGVGDIHLGRIGPTDASVIAETREGERSRRDQERAEAEVRAAERRAEFDLRRSLAEIASPLQA